MARINDLIELLQWLVVRRDWRNILVVLDELKNELEKEQ